MVKHTLKILRCERRKIFDICLAIFQYHALKGVRGSTEIELQFIDFVLSPFWEIGLSFAVLMILRNTVGNKWVP